LTTVALAKVVFAIFAPSLRSLRLFFFILST
jgi:hypothetical protein